MPLPPLLLRLPVRVGLAAVCALAFNGPARAADHGGHDAAPAAKARPSGKAEAKPEAPAPAPAPSKRAAAGPKDPMDLVRERLAEKLGATKAPNAPNPNVLRVTARAAETESVAAKEAGGHGGGHAAPARAPARAAAKPVALASAHGAAGAAGSAHWDYAGPAGPEAWGALKPEFAKCSSGTRQSPVDIRDGVKVQLDDVQFDYKPSAFRVIDNGHTIQVNVAAGNGIEVQGRRFELLQFHFHRPSEERINGKQFDMVAHLVHKDAEGKLAVVAVLLDRGSWQPVVQAVWNNLPLEKGEELAAQSQIDLNELLPKDRSYFTYMGSLTTPPCSEGVLWMVLRTPMPVSQQQIGIFSRLYPMNARPIQALAGRLIKESN